MLYLENLLLWDSNRAPVRIPRITVDPEKLSASLAGGDGWIVAGPYRIKVIVEQTENGFAVMSSTGSAVASATCGAVFIDDSMFEVQMLDGAAAAVAGGVRGCFDFSWD